MVSPFPFLIFSLLCFSVHVVIALNEDAWGGLRLLVRKDQRRTLVSTEYGEVSAVEVSDEIRGPYHLEFITLEPNALFLPVILHADMVFYVHTGSGRLSWTQGEEMVRVRLQRGDVYRLQPGAAFFVQSNLDTQREKLRITAIFASSSDDLHEPSIGAYSSINDLIRGFDKKVLQAAFKAPEEVIEAYNKCNITSNCALGAKEKTNLVGVGSSIH
ncbi:hypothetical protein L1049_025334 [Liquidambar formosana]|uniref:Cupin type-1 domain-containing protein n=1 Tax=Liquidambar formosana TaxID=63359 RepID=A0AAP0R1Y2_LIQFO